MVSSISSDLAYTAQPFDAAVAVDLSPESLNVALDTLKAPQLKRLVNTPSFPNILAPERSCPSFLKRALARIRLSVSDLVESLVLTKLT